MRWAGTRRGLRRSTTQAFAAFGVVALLLQSYQAVWDKPAFPGHAPLVTAVVAIGSIAFGLLRARPGGSVHRDLRQPDCRITVAPGDLFDQQDAHLVIGFTDVFDTDCTDDRIINRSSVQAQFLHHVYQDNRDRLDRDLDAALAGVPGAVVIPRAEKPHGKRRRFPAGTVAVLGTPTRSYFCLAYSSMTADLVARSSGDVLWHSLSRLWPQVSGRGQRGTIAMPVVGAALARVDTLDRGGLLRLILFSFVAASRVEMVSRELRIIVPREQFEELDRLELQAFLDSL
jgi:hypothetical protein